MKVIPIFIICFGVIVIVLGSYTLAFTNLIWGLLMMFSGCGNIAGGLIIFNENQSKNN